MAVEHTIEGEISGYPIFVASDITIAPPETIKFYREIRDTCKRSGKNVFLPLDAVGSTKSPSVPAEKAYEVVMSNLNSAQLGVFYVGFISTDVGMMLGRAKTNELPIILLYEANKENWLREKEPKIWWRPKTKKELASNPPGGMITPIGYNSTMVPESRYHMIAAEIKFNTEEEGLSKLEKEVKNFFTRYS
ncbi:MAG: hypothetical protein V1645_03135 [archaeon]